MRTKETPMDRIAKDGFPALAYGELLKGTNSDVTILAMVLARHKLGLTHYVRIDESGKVLNLEVP